MHRSCRCSARRLAFFLLWWDTLGHSARYLLHRLVGSELALSFFSRVVEPTGQFGSATQSLNWAQETNTSNGQHYFPFCLSLIQSCSRAVPEKCFSFAFARQKRMNKRAGTKFENLIWLAGLLGCAGPAVVKTQRYSRLID